MRSQLTAVFLVFLTGLTGLAGCGEATVVDAPAANGAYDGPMDLPISYADRADVWERGGSAARALECVDEPSNSGGADYDSGLASTQRTPAAAVDNWMDEEGELA